MRCSPGRAECGQAAIITVILTFINFFWTRTQPPAPPPPCSSAFYTPPPSIRGKAYFSRENITIDIEMIVFLILIQSEDRE